MTAERVRHAIGLVLFVCFGIGVAIYLLGRVGTHLLPEGKQYTFQAVVKTSEQLANAADVREAGVKIGQVNGIRQDGTMTELELTIGAKYGPVYKDGTILIRSKSIADENYVALTPGNPRSGSIPNGGLLPVSQELQPVQDDTVFSILNTPERTNLQHALEGLGPGLAGQGGSNLNQTIGATTSLVNQAQNLSQVLAEERAQVSQLVDSFGTVTAALGSRAADIQTLTRAALSTASAVSTRNAQLQSTISTLPSFLSQARVTSGQLGSFSVNATPVMSNLRIATQDLVPAVQDLRPAANSATTALAELAKFAGVAKPTFRKLVPFANRTRAFVSPYSSVLQQVNPIVAYLNPYWRELSTWFANDGAAVQDKDDIGHLARVLLPISRSNFPTIISGPEATLLSKLSGGLDTRGTDAYPPPGSADTPEPQPATIPPLQADPPYQLHNSKR